MGERRATTQDERAARRRLLLSATSSLLEKWSLEDVNVDRIADLAGVSKGTVYLYFRTREELILEVFDHHHGRWLERLAAAIREAPGDPTPGDIGRILVATLAESPLLLQLFGRIGGLLGGSVSPEAAQLLRSRQEARRTEVARVLDRRLPTMTVLKAEQWLIRVEALIAGIASLAPSPAPRTRTVDSSGVRLLDLDLESEMQYIAATMLLSS